VWIASYPRAKDDLVHIESTATSECPTSIVTPEMDWLLQQFHSNRMAAKAGASLFGPNANRWPAWWADAVEALTSEHAHANNIQGITD
jgi:hypothetical protein